MPNSFTGEEEIVPRKIESQTTFFYTGMDIPVKNTEAIQKIKKFEKSFCLNKLDFKTKLEAATDKIVAFKNYFYGKEPNYM